MMTANTNGSVLRLLRWQARNALLYTFAGVVAWAVWELFENRLAWVDIEMPALPLAIVGGALGIFVSFRVNAAYDRWWEGRKLWGRLINASRHWASQVQAYVPEAHQDRLTRRHIAYVHLLRVLLRGQEPAEDDDLRRFLTDEEREALPEESNGTHFLLDEQLREVRRLSQEGHTDPLEVQSLDQTVRALLDIQGGCERIKKTPVPPGYGFIAVTLIRYFAFLLPLAIVEQVSFLAIPINVLVCLSFMLINEAGRVLEDPFSLFWNGLPLQNMSTTIEHNLLNRLGVRRSSLPVIPGPDADGILM